jgi:hypothetical protein
MIPDKDLIKANNEVDFRITVINNIMRNNLIAYFSTAELNPGHPQMYLDVQKYDFHFLFF